MIVVAALLAGGAAWFAVEALSRSAKSVAEKELRTGVALAKAKHALLAYVAHYAARSDHQTPGRLPCPEPLAPPAGQEGVAGSLGCLGNSQTYLGRLPWRTLGIEQLRDGHGEPLWYVLGPGFRAAPINFDSPGRLALDGTANAAVALIIAPGAPLDTLLDPESPPPGCARGNQSPLRYPRPFSAFDPAQFLDCGNAAGSFATTGNARWFNDRVMAVSAAELMDAIAGPLQDRLQRVLAPAIASWDAAEFAATGKSWGATHGAAYLPFASTFGNPAANGFCGAPGVLEGLAPVAARASPVCDTSWLTTPVPLSGLADPACVALATEARCTFRVTGEGLPSARLGARAPRVTGSFRGTIAATDIGASHGGVAQLTMALSAAAGDALASVEVTWPALSAGTIVSVTLPQLPDARLLGDARLAWFFNNQWQRHVYYAAAPAAVAGASSTCGAAGEPGCITANGMLPSTGSAADKRLVIALMGRALPGQSRACGDANANGVPDCDEAAQYLEAENASAGDGQFRADLRVPAPVELPQPWPAFNDRLAVCPLHFTRQNGARVQICG